MSHFKLHEVMARLERLVAGNRDFDAIRDLHRFAALDTNLDRVNFVYKYLEKYNIFLEFVKDEKDDAAAIEHRQNGNIQFGLGNYLKALEDYTRSIATAKTEGLLALAYANRSACLYRLSMREGCLQDIERALANNYPDELRPKLINRRNEAQKLPIPTESYHEEIPKIPDREKNPRIQCARNCVEIQKNEEFGRHVVATRDIQIGEVLAVEKPFVCVLSDHRLIHCHDSMELCYNPIPCQNCTQALFCGENCKEKAQNSYHKYECPILKSLYESGMDLILTTLRTALLAKEDYRELSGLGFVANEVYCSDRYKEIHNLKSLKPVVHDLFYSSMVTALAFQLLHHTIFFDDQDIEDNFKEIMLLQTQTIRLNQVKIEEYVQEGVGYENVGFAAGVYSFFSCFNHSCCSNVGRSFYGSTVVLRANNTIKKGQQCFCSYGPRYDIDSRTSRQKKLFINFEFDCKCRACEENWTPIYEGIALIGEFGAILVECGRAIAVDVKFAKRILPDLESQLRRCEELEPLGNSLILKTFIRCCYVSLGNNRRL